MANLNQQKEFLSSQSLVPIDQIRDGIIILKNGGLRSVLKVSGLNFELKSESEQNDLIIGWRNFINNIDFSLQIIIQSRKLNINDYLDTLSQKFEKEPNELLKIQAQDYLEFLRNFVGLYGIIRKTFYVIVTYESMPTKPAGLVGKFSEGFKSMFNLTRPAFTTTVKISDEDFIKYQKQLLIRQDGVISGLSRLGLEAVPLTTEELIQLFYNLYNPETLEKQKLEISSDITLTT